MIAIEKGIPIPVGSGRRSQRKYPWDEMTPGDSFFAPMPMRSMMSAITFAKKRTRKRFTARSVTENGVAGVRVWCFSDAAVSK